MAPFSPLGVNCRFGKTSTVVHICVVRLATWLVKSEKKPGRRGFLCSQESDCSGWEVLYLSWCQPKYFYPSVLQWSSSWKHYKPEQCIGWQQPFLIRNRFLQHMVSIDKTPRAWRGNVVLPANESGLEAPVSLLVFHLNCFHCIMLNCYADRQLFRLGFNLFARCKASHTATCF